MNEAEFLKPADRTIERERDREGEGEGEGYDAALS